MSPPEKLLTIGEAANIFGVSIKTIRRRIASGELRANRNGRILRIEPMEMRRLIEESRT